MRTETHQVEGFRIRFAIDQHKVGSDVTVTMILPFPNQGMIVMTLRERLIGDEHGNHPDQVVIERLAMLALIFALVISLEDAGALIVRIQIGP